MKRLFSFLLITALIITAIPFSCITSYATTSEFAGGSGTADDPYLIETTQQLYSVRNYPKAFFKQMANLEFKDEDFLRGGLFYNGGYGWTGCDFCGSYDGNGYTVCGFKGATGVFKSLDSATVKNIKITDANITNVAETELYYDSFYWHGVGALANIAEDSTVENCHTYGDIELKSTDDIDNGGLIGVILKTNVRNCTNSCNFSVDGEESRLGGLIGAVLGDSEIKKCINSGTLISYNGSVGGISSFSRGCGLIDDCENYGNIDGKNEYEYSGGILGIGATSGGSAIIKNCYNAGTVRGYRDVGGIVGDLQTSGLISNCVNTGNVVGLDTYVSGGANYIGGIAGSSPSIENCINKGYVFSRSTPLDYAVSWGWYDCVSGIGTASTIRGCVNYGEVHTTHLAGGISSGRWGQIISDCYNYGNVSARVSGGITGSGSPSVSKCYNSGAVYGSNSAGGIAGTMSENVSDCYNTGTIEGGENGGIVGHLNGGYIENCYNVGEIEQSENYGAICSKNESGSITNSLFMKADNLYAVGFGFGDAPSYGEEMLDKATYTGFDFEEAWTMEGNGLYPFPELQSIPMTICEGDINNNGTVSIADTVVLLRKIAENPDGQNIITRLAADVDHDGELTTADVVAILQLMLNKQY